MVKTRPGRRLMPDPASRRPSPGNMRNSARPYGASSKNRSPPCRQWEDARFSPRALRPLRRARLSWSEVPRGVRRPGRQLPARRDLGRGAFPARRFRTSRRRDHAHASIAMPPVFKFGDEWQRRQWLVPIRGEDQVPSGSPNPAPVPTWPRSAPSRGRWMAAMWSTDRRPSSPTGSGPTSWSAPSDHRKGWPQRDLVPGHRHRLTRLQVVTKLRSSAGMPGHRRDLLHRRGGSGRTSAG